MSHCAIQGWAGVVCCTAVIAAAAVCGAAPAEFAAVLHAGEEVTPCVPDYYVDRTNSLDFEAVRGLADDAWTHSRRAVVNLGALGDPVWLRVTVRNETGGSQFVFEYANPRTTYVEFFRPRKTGSYVVQHAGPGYRSANGRPTPHLQMSPAFDLSLPSGATETYYFRLENTGIMRFNLRLW